MSANERTRSISWFGEDYEQPVGKATALRLAGDRGLPRMGYEIEIVTKPNSQETLRLGNFSGQLALFSLQPKSEWMRLYGIDPEKP